jgi:hypothetical protein
MTYLNSYMWNHIRFVQSIKIVISKINESRSNFTSYSWMKQQKMVDISYKDQTYRFSQHWNFIQFLYHFLYHQF